MCKHKRLGNLWSRFCCQQLPTRSSVFNQSPLNLRSFKNSLLDLVVDFEQRVFLDQLKTSFFKIVKNELVRILDFIPVHNNIFYQFHARFVYLLQYSGFF